MHVDHRTLARMMCVLAHITLTDGDPRPINAIETAQRWLDGNATLRELTTAKLAAYDYAREGGNPAAAYAASVAFACTNPISLGHCAWPYAYATINAFSAAIQGKQ